MEHVLHAVQYRLNCNGLLYLTIVVPLKMDPLGVYDDLTVWVFGFYQRLKDSLAAP